MIKSSLEWPVYEKLLVNKTLALTHGFQVRQMIRNIRPDITILSKAEVEKRQGRRLATTDILLKINNNIDMVEEYLLVAALIG